MVMYEEIFGMDISEISHYIKLFIKVRIQVVNYFFI